MHSACFRAKLAHGVLYRPGEPGTLAHSALDWTSPLQDCRMPLVSDF